MASVEVLNNFIGGNLVPCSRHIDSYNPATGEVHLKVPDSGQDEVNLAVEAAKQAFESWSKTAPSERSKVMMKIADLVESRIEEFARAESKDQGKPVWLARQVDMQRVCNNFRFFATAILHDLEHAEQLHDRGAYNYIQRMPVGVAGIISPWNLPLYLLTFKIAPCIAYGNTCVCKPSEMTSLTAHMLCKVLVEAGGFCMQSHVIYM
jgi:acyl-CoA reductase-like NAD-dependent aldehyde dehydrogenase